MDEQYDIEKVMALLTEEMATRQAVSRIVRDAYPVTVNVMAELSHRVDHSIDEETQ